jgi:hypothetical protein
MREEVPRRIARLWQAPQHNVVYIKIAKIDTANSVGTFIILGTPRIAAPQVARRSFSAPRFF